MRLNLKTSSAFYYIKEAFRLGSKGGSRQYPFFDYYGLARGFSLPNAIKHALWRIHSENKFPYNFSCVGFKCQVVKTKQLTKNKQQLLVNTNYKYKLSEDGDYFNCKKQYWVILEKKNSKYFKWKK